jgi:tRNA(Ile)-lysidine synthase
MNSTDFVASFRKHFPDVVGSSVLVALSGGRDSVALLHLLRAPALDLELTAAHVHHGLRGDEADADARWCLEHCRSLGVPIEVLALPTDDEKPATGEAAWRRRRYRALIDHAADQRFSHIATANHRDDVAEGVLLQLLRGAGPRSMAGIARATPDGVIRPLLDWDRTELTEWLERHGVAWREDSSNTDTSRLRNLVRHRILPLLEEDSPQLRTHLVALAAANAETERFLAAELVARAPFADPWDPEGGVSVDRLCALPRALRTRWLHGQTNRLGISSASRRQLALFHGLLDEGVPRSVTLAGRWRLRRAGGRLWAEPPVDPQPVSAVVSEGDVVGLGVPGWAARLATRNDRDETTRWWWPCGSGKSVISVRPAAAADVLPSPSGKRRSVRKLIAAHLPRHLRSAWPVFCEDDMIRWIPGVWQHSKPGDPHNRIVEVIRQ